MGSSAIEHRGAVHDGARDAQALLLAAGERHRHRLLAREQAHLVEGRAHAPAGFVAREAGDAQRQRHVLERVAVEEQLVVLEDEADAPAQHRERGLAERAQVLPVHEHACRRSARSMPAASLSSVDLPAPEWPVTATISPAGDVERDAAQRLVAARVALGDRGEADHAKRARRTPRRRRAAGPRPSRRCR